MPKRDYKSYNILQEANEEEIVQSKATPLQESEHQSNNNPLVMEQGQVVEEPCKKIELAKAPETKQEDESAAGELKEETFKDKTIVTHVITEELSKDTRIIKEDKKLENAHSIEECKIYNEDSGTRRDNPFNLREDNFFREKQEDFKKTEAPEYKRYYEQKKRSKFFRWLMRLGVLVITIMLSPLILALGFVALCIVGAFGVTIAVCIGGGLFGLGAVAFTASQLTRSILALGIILSITGISFGGIVLILFLMLIKWIRNGIHYGIKPRLTSGHKGGR